MAGELEEFLKQAAERLAEKVKQAQNPAPRPARQMPPPSVRVKERSTRRTVEAEIVEAEVIESRGGSPEANRRLGPDPLSDIDTRPGLAQEIGLADEKMASHLHEVFDHSVSNLGKGSAMLSPRALGETEKSINLQRRQTGVSPLVDMLRQPATLRAAFIASEIFKRKF